MNRRLFIAFVLAMVGGCASDSGGRADVVYLALGASDAIGIGAIPLRRGYVFRIADALRDRGFEVDLMNLGIPGAQVDAISRVARVAPLLQPDLVTLWTGANDLIDGADPDAFEKELGDLLGFLRKSTRAQIVIGDLPDLTQIPRFVDNPSRVVTSARVEAFNRAILAQAQRFDVAVARLSQLDMLAQLTSDIDGFHPNNRGHEMIAEQFLARIDDRRL
jgi:acyl-CoA thioesterase I